MFHSIANPTLLFSPHIRPLSKTRPTEPLVTLNGYTSYDIHAMVGLDDIVQCCHTRIEDTMGNGVNVAPPDAPMVCMRQLEQG